MSDQSAAFNRDQRKGERIARPQSFDYLRFGLIAVFHTRKRPRCNVSDGGTVALLFLPYHHNAEPIGCRLSGVNIYWRNFDNEVGRGQSAGYGGRGGIRTHEARERLPVFKTGAFNHSATLPS